MVRWAQPMPAELTTARSGAISAAALTAALIWSVLVTSTWAKTPPISWARASPLSACRSATTTIAPLAASWRAAAAPMPDAPPVTMALAPLMSMAAEHSHCDSGTVTVLRGRSYPGPRRRPGR